MRLNELLEASAARASEAAAAFEPDGRSASYRELDQHAEQISRALARLGVGPGDRVGLCAPKEIATLAAVFGVLKAGGAYVPVDVASPPARNAYVFNDCAVKAIVVDAAKADALEAELGGAWTRSAFPALAERGASFVILAPSAPRASAAPPDGLAYILYTSGSTGRPKGVMHSHATALAFIDWCSRELEPTAEDRFSSHAPFHFDLSILDIYVPLKHGGAVVLIGAEPGKQPGVLAQIIADRKITVWYSTPSILRMLVEHGDLAAKDYSALRTVIFAGEVFPIKHLRALIEIWRGRVCYNLYGPTETNVCTFHRLDGPLPPEREAALPIGAACSDDRTLVVEPDGRAVAAGAEGELLVSGGSVMLGYWNLPERDAEAFVTIAGERWYRTGDVVREDEAGDYVFLGRRDRMVKRRGYRVELGEIEAALHRHPAVSEAAAIAVVDAEGETRIRAFLTWSDATPFSMIKMKQFCAQTLPLYMSPDQFTVLPALPKTSTDKIDYQLLKVMD
jgi:amino acid adenylation domain-containing protein